ncbi:hypothetical protein ACF06O_30735 [Streptomyces albidoflavus]
MSISAGSTHVTDPEAEETDPRPGRGHRAAGRLRAWLGLGKKKETAPPPPPAASASPWWAELFVGTGQPLAVVVVMLMCAPGERHLAKLAGWHQDIAGVDLAWGMAVLLAGYAGMAAYLAGKRKRGTPGHRTAVVGAVASLGLAMAAQPVSHLFVTGWFSAEPRTPWGLVVVVSCVPPLVLGHVLHLAATRPGTPVPAASLLTTDEVAEELGITTSAVRSRVSRGRLVPALKDPELGNLFDPSTIRI